MQREINHRQIVLVEGDITAEVVDAIVNAANSHLAGGGGVDGAIHRKAGPTLMAETRKLYPHGCPTGSAVITGAGNLSAQYVIHAVGPIWQGGDSGESELLAAAYLRSFELASQHHCRSIALPALSAGVYGFPLEPAARIALQTAVDFLQRNPKTTLRTVRFVLFSGQVYSTFASVLEELVSL